MKVVRIVCLVVYYLPKKSGDFGWNLNGKPIFFFPNGNFHRKTGFLERQSKISNRNFRTECVYHLRFSLVPSPTPILMRVTCYLVGVVQMVHANPERNFSLGIFAYHLYKPSANQFYHVNGEQPPSSAKRDDDDTSIHIGITLFVLNHHLGLF